MNRAEMDRNEMDCNDMDCNDMDRNDMATAKLDWHWHRLLDVNINRAAEGLRVLEDLAKFVLQRRDLTEGLRRVRHGVRKAYPEAVAWARLPQKDMGFDISKAQVGLDSKKDFWALVQANEARVAEALRVLEEVCHGQGERACAKAFEALRHDFYRLNFSAIKAQVSGLYALIDGSGDWAAQLKLLRTYGVQWVQYRDKGGTGKLRYAVGQQLRQQTAALGMHLIVNDDVALAVAIGADGVHLGQDDLPVAAARLMAPHLVIGLSTHNRQQLLEALEAPVDYIAVGPLYETKSKENPEPCEGIGLLAFAKAHTQLPVVAIGGVGPQTLLTLRAAGADAVAAIAAFSNEETLKLCQQAWDSDRP